MRIINGHNERNWVHLSNYHGGTPVRFRHPFHTDVKNDDVFMVNNVCSSYRPDDIKYEGKIAVSNMRTGKLSYISGQRECVLIECHVRLEEADGHSC